MADKFNRRDVLKGTGASIAATAAAGSANAEEPTVEHPISNENPREITAPYQDLSVATETIESTADALLEELADSGHIENANANSLEVNGLTETPDNLDQNVQVTAYYDRDEEVGRPELNTAVENEDTVVGITVKPEEGVSYAVIGDKNNPETKNSWIFQNADTVTSFTDDEVLRSCGDYCEKCPWIGKRRKNITLVFPNLGRTEDRGCGCTTYGYDAVKYCCKDSCCKALCW